MKNRLCDILNIKYPIIEGGMAHVGNGELAAAVSNGGGLGQVGSAGRSVENFEEEILLASQQTKHPFGVNLPISEHKDNQPYIDVIEKHKDKIKAVSISSGNPSPFIPIFKNMGLVVMVITATCKHAIKAESVGADLVVCEGYEAGGHNGGEELTTFALIPQVAKAVKIPVVAAGGIMNGQGVLAAMVLGAEGVQMGTRFVASLECEAHAHYKQLLVESNDVSTTILTRRIGGVIRVINTEFVEKIKRIGNEEPSVEAILPYVRGHVNRQAAIDGDFDGGWASAGQGVGLISNVESATDIVKSIMEEFNESLESLNGMKDQFMEV